MTVINHTTAASSPVDSSMSLLRDQLDMLDSFAEMGWHSVNGECFPSEEGRRLFVNYSKILIRLADDIEGLAEEFQEVYGIPVLQCSSGIFLKASSLKLLAEYCASFYSFYDPETVDLEGRYNNLVEIITSVVHCLRHDVEGMVSLTVQEGNA